VLRFKSVILVIFIFSAVSFGQCDFEWKTADANMNDYVSAFTVYNGELIIGGRFTTAGGIDANSVVRWDGSIWRPMGGGMNSSVYTLTVYNGEPIAGGWFTRADGADVNHITRWDGSKWQPMGSGMEGTNASVSDLTVYNGELIAGGHFSKAGGTSIKNIARWDGDNWQPLGSGINGWVCALTVYDGNLIAGGDFTTAGEVTANKIARWDGSTWQPLGSGPDDSSWRYVSSLTVYNGKLIAGIKAMAASYNDAPVEKENALNFNYIACWDGSTWGPLGSGIDGFSVDTLTVYNGELVAGGYFEKAGGVDANHIARWNGHDWQPMSGGMNSEPDVLTVYKGELIAGGWFSVPSPYLARWGVPEPIEGDLNHDCGVDWLDLEWLVGQWLDDDCLYNGWCYEADLNYDLSVNFADFTKLGSNWWTGDTTHITGDFNNDDKVDMADLGTLILYWLKNKPDIDIAPAGGDNIINFLDYAVFAANWLEEP